MEALRRLLVSCEWHIHDLAPGPTVLSKDGRRPGKDHQCAGKRVRSGPREEVCTNKETSVDRPDVDP